MANTAQNETKPLDPKAIKPLQKMPEETPVLPSLAKTMGVELLVNSSDVATVFINQELPEKFWWAEYDVDLEQMYFITVGAKIQGLGFKIFDRQHECLVKCKTVNLIRMKENDKFDMPYKIPLVVRRHTLSEVDYGG